MEVVEEDVVIVGAGISELTTSLGLHRLGIRSLVLESFDSLRVTGFAFTTWTNAWRALDAVGVSNSLRQQHETLQGNVVSSRISGLQTFEMSFEAKEKQKLLLEALASELPSDTIRFSSNVVSIEESGYFKLVHLADGIIFKAKVVVGCDGVNSVVAKWLGFKSAVFTGRSAIRGSANFNSSHGLDPVFMQYFGSGVRSGAISCDNESVYWYFTWSPSSQVLDVISKGGVQGVTHVTGGSFTDNFSREFLKGLGAVIYNGSWEVPPAFKWIQEAGRVEDAKLKRTLNIGIGMVLVVSKEVSQRILERMRMMLIALVRM